MKHDLPPRPKRVPQKDRQLAKVPDLWIAQWLDSDDLTRADRDRLTALKAVRRRAEPDVPVGLLVGAEGLTGRQLQRVIQELNSAHPTEVHHPGDVPPKLHSACKRLGVPIVQHRDVRNTETGMRNVVHMSARVIAAPREMSESATGSAVWNMVKHAKHRSVPVTVILPDGRVVGQRDQ